MFAGFDYGSSNCAVGVMKDTQVELLLLADKQRYIPSTLYALDRALIAASVADNIQDPTLKPLYTKLRAAQLQGARVAKNELDIKMGEQTIFVGQSAIDNYIEFPDEGYFVKSPKSFLGVNGLRADQVTLFEDIVCAMMQSIKQQAEHALNKNDSSQHVIDKVVIGRPVNFQGSGGEKSNEQAIAILSTAANRAGYNEVEFLYEPLAAGIDFETELTTDKTVLVVDIGGGTTDCSMVKMGPSHRNKEERKTDFLGHSGQRIGGNDLDIYLSYQAFMPLFGLKSKLKSGIVLPNEPFWNAVRTNDIPAQTSFNNLSTEKLLELLLRDAAQPNLVQRMIALREHKNNHQLVRNGELSKIALSDSELIEANLAFVEQGLSCKITSDDFAQAIQSPLNKIKLLIDEVVEQAQCQPDLVYVTGGTAKSPVIRQAINEKFGEIPIMDGDHFGSVTSGLTKWAEKIFS